MDSGGRLSPTGGQTGVDLALGSLADVETDGAEEGDALVFNGEGWQPGQGTVDVPPLPTPAYATTATTGAAVTASAFANLPNPVSASLTLEHDCWVLISYSAWLVGTFTSGQDLRVGVAGTGATVFPEQTTSQADAYNNWGGVLFAGVSQGTAGTKQHSATRLVKFLAGTTTVTMRAYINGTPTTPYVNYPQLVLTPIQYDGMGALVGRGATGPAGPTGPTGPAGSGEGGGPSNTLTTVGTQIVEIGVAGNGTPLGTPDSSLIDLSTPANPDAHGYIYGHLDGGVVIAADDSGGEPGIGIVVNRGSWSSWSSAIFLSDLLFTASLFGEVTLSVDHASGDIDSAQMTSILSRLAALESAQVFTGDATPANPQQNSVWIRRKSSPDIGLFSGDATPANPQQNSVWVRKAT